MGYTHYFQFNKVPKSRALDIERRYRKACKDITTMAMAYNDFSAITGQDRLAGYSAHTDKYGGVQFNGSQADGECEDFSLREHFNENGSGGFVKTNGHPYDRAVTAALAILKHRLGDAITVTSDGRESDFIKGTALASVILGVKVKNPLKGKK